MQHQIIARPARPTSFATLAAWRGALRSPLAIVVLATVLIVAINPLGYRGGNADDWHYLSAARCAAEQGFCLPGDHWWRRFPLVLPSGGALALFGETRLGLWLVPVLFGLTCIALFVTLVQRQFGRLEALLAGLVLVAVPVFSERLLEMQVDTVEFAFVLASLFFIQRGHRCGGAAGWLALAGVMLGLAIQARPTSLPLVPIFMAGLAIAAPLRRQLWAFLLGLAVPIACEALVYGLWAGDPLLPWKLSLGHTGIPTSELAPGVDLSQSPLFNIAYIDGWVPSMGIEAHWTIEGLINLLLHPGIGLTLTCGIIFIAINWRALGTAVGGGRLLPFLIGGAMLLFGALVYGLAVDPKPRMFLPVAAVASVCFGVFAARSWRVGNRLLALVCLALMLTKAGFASYNRLDLDGAGELARSWVGQEPAGSLAVDGLSARFLTLTPEVRALPIYKAGSANSVLVLGAPNCRKAARVAGYERWRIRRSHLFNAPEPRVIEMLRNANLFLNTRFVPALCLLDAPRAAAPMQPAR